MKTDGEVKAAMDVLYKTSWDKEAIMIAEAREKAIMDEQSRLNGAIKESIEKENMNSREIISTVAHRYNVNSVGIFGSRARDDYREDSDYDIFIIGDLNLEQELALEAELEALLNVSVDVIKLNKNNDKILLKNIVNDAEVLYSENNAFENLYEFVEIFFMENSDFIHMRERDLID